MRIKQVVESLFQKYKTRDPFEIASYNNIQVLFEPLGGVRGYYNQIYRNKMIHINSGMPQEQRRFTCAHELGHALLHPVSNTPFLLTNTLFCVNKFEHEANCFAINLLISDEDLMEYESYSVPEIAAIYCLDEKLIEYRMKAQIDKRNPTRYRK